MKRQLNHSELYLRPTLVFIFATCLAIGKQSVDPSYPGQDCPGSANVCTIRCWYTLTDIMDLGSLSDMSAWSGSPIEVLRQSTGISVECAPESDYW